MISRLFSKNLKRSPVKIYERVFFLKNRLSIERDIAEKNVGSFAEVSEYLYFFSSRLKIEQS